ncbi:MULTISPECIES: phosphotransferase [unclassified Mesorhizobium]|uniref:phosphotransferase n=1 Tax=unclassified Mesorhizobium TaxID=325217 RepID=UPI002415420E|nr:MULTISPECIES: phosphotransferase [unclassified Mesorhizobium]MDG4889883.1 phosphotransferase [Mesorhizobium sp. WSM4887]MDG4904026.1 phosphotransferase [Mesorhizobium sp. WSM4962]MDG4909053.1 phosphotransferase [Mesorhizobium sp. WSM4898]MDG4921677.1 phosphotransferase [Mesorhizobium sp. WSM4989]
MAVFTALTDKDRDFIASAYGMTSLSSVVGIADGDRETTYLFRTKQDEFIVTLFENGAEPLDLERAFATMETLHENGVPCPKPMRTTDGLATLHAAGRLVAIVSFVSGSSTNVPTLARCGSLGQVMALVHTILQRSPKTQEAQLPTGAVHGALVHQNVFFLGDVVSGVINFRLRHDDVLVSEIADVLVGWASQPNGELDRNKTSAILAGYQSVRTLMDTEKAALPGFVLASAARRYASDHNKSRLPGAAILAYGSMQLEVMA